VVELGWCARVEKLLEGSRPGPVELDESCDKFLMLQNCKIGDLRV